MSHFVAWPHQDYAVTTVLAHAAKGVRRILLTSPTGGGKSKIVADIIHHVSLTNRPRAIVLTNRKLLVEQLTKSLRGFGLAVGVRAAGSHKDDTIDVQVSSIQTEESRVYKKRGHLKWELFAADWVFVDEAHINTGDVAQKIMKDYLARGAIIVLVTATPLDMKGLADVMVQAGTNSELRKCGALVPALHFGPDEPDLRYIGRTAVTQGDDVSEEQARTLMGRIGQDGKASIKLQKLFGRVFENYQRLNPEGRPTILFAPGVPESEWFASEFVRLGVQAAHIDGTEIWTEATGTMKSNRATRDELLDMTRQGAIKVLCNRFVLREGIDVPELSHGILATRFGSLQSYLQSVGRLLRACKGKENATLQDHGGNWWAHGSVNADREWALDMFARRVKGEREDRLRDKSEKGEREPMCCPRCKLILLSLRCPCGFTLDASRKRRAVVMESGDLQVMEGDVYPTRVTRMEPDTAKLWLREYWKARNAKTKPLTFRQAIANFYLEHHYWPPTDLPNMPRNRDDQWRLVKDVSMANLVEKADGN